MTAAHGYGDPQRAIKAPGRGPIATSLFGGAILATVATTVATAALAQTYLNSITALGSITVAAGTYVVALGYNTAGDGGGGTFVPGVAGTPTGTCTPDGGLVFQDAASHCFYRADPTKSVREWGAFCDVVAGASGNGETAVWTPGSPHGTLTVDNRLLTPTQPKNGQFIVLSQVGGPTLWSNAMSASVPAVSMTRFSTLTGSQGHYAPGNLISFTGATSPGSFAQQGAIIVDAVDSSGSITQWHFLWGGLYDPGVSSNGTLSQDDTHSYCGSSGGTIINCGTGSGGVGAQMIPAWSGWSLLNSQKIQTGGTRYAVGDIVTLASAGATVNGTHSPQLIVEGTTTTIVSGVTYTGWVTAYDWLDYGSFSSLSASGTATLTASGSTGAGTGLTFSPVGWTRGPFATKIATATPVGANTVITLTDDPSFPGTITISNFYYGDDDAGHLSAAIKAAPKGGLIIPAGCGTTQTLNLSPPGDFATANPAQNFNVVLKGGNLQSSGIYAFAQPMASRNTSPVLAHVIYSGILNAANTGFLTIPGGGFRNMFVEGFGLPQGYGYYGATAPAGFEAPHTPPSVLPTAGNVVQIDAASLMHIDKVLISDGGIGPGNSVLQCGLDESDPANNLHTNSIANIVLTDSRLDGNSSLSGATNPDFTLRLGASCHDSVFDAVTAYDGTKADILVYNNSLFGRTHVNSDAANAGASLSFIPWPSSTSFGLAGVADYGFYVIGNTSLSETQCDIANKACVLTIPNTAGGSLYPGQITDTQVKCGPFADTPLGYSGVELSAGTANSTVGGTSAAGDCTINPVQLVRLDGPADLRTISTSLCNNSNALVAGCTGYQGGFAQGQAYTQPAVAYSTLSASGNVLFAVPFFSPATGGTINKLGVNVTAWSTGSATQCLLGIYNSIAQAPTSLIVSKAVTVSGIGTPKATALGAQLSPGTLYFLAVGCNAAVTLDGVIGPGGLSVPLVGAQVLTDTASGIISSSWIYPTSPIALPNPFGASSQVSGAWVPNVYAEP